MKCPKCGAEIEGKFCGICGTPIPEYTANSDLQNNADYQQTKNKKSKIKKDKKPFYKKPSFIIIMAIILIGAIKGISTEIKENKTEKIVWSELVMGERLPQPEAKRGHIHNNDIKLLSIDLKKVSEIDYNNYIEDCKKMGYTVDPLNEYSSFTAFNSDGYMLYLHCSDDSMSIKLEAPIAFSKIQWPNNALGKQLPTPESLVGKFVSEYDTSFDVKISNTPFEAYNTYVNKCMDKGFNLDYSKDERNFSGYNSDKYHVNIEYVGNNIMEISISAPSKTDVEEDTTTTTKATTTTTTAKQTTTIQNKQSYNSSGLRTDFKNAMDSYESFMDEYVAFMKKYAESGGTDLSLLTDYASYLDKYDEMCDDFDKWEDEDLNDAELAYYLGVQSRVTQKLLEVSF